jgi:hypothetical protein
MSSRPEKAILNDLKKLDKKLKNSLLNTPEYRHAWNLLYREHNSAYPHNPFVAPPDEEPIPLFPAVVMTGLGFSVVGLILWGSFSLSRWIISIASSHMQEYHQVAESIEEGRNFTAVPNPRSPTTVDSSGIPYRPDISPRAEKSIVNNMIDQGAKPEEARAFVHEVFEQERQHQRKMDGITQSPR